MKTYKKPKFNFWFYKTYFKWKPYTYLVKKLLWKDKFESPRVELEPQFRIEWLWFGFIAIRGCDNTWEQWLWVHKYNDGDVEKAKDTWPWLDGTTKLSTWKDN